MKFIFTKLILLAFFLSSCQKAFALEKIDFLRSFEKEITKSSTFDSLGSLKESIVFSTELASIKNKGFLQELAENPQESFYIKADHKSLQIIASTNQGIENGIFYYLHFLGFRYYFPNTNWHYYPDLKTIFKPLEGVFKPDFLNRRLSYGYGTGSKKATKDFNFWKRANLMGNSILGFTGHSYEQIIDRNKKSFLNHPEYFAQKTEKGKIPKNPKFDISNPELVQLVVQDALQLAEQYNKEYGPKFIISLDPSDGGGYCDKPSCHHWKNVSDQVYYLANQAAKEIKQYYPKAYVGLYAYNLHASPPTFQLEDNIVIYIATSFNKSQYEYDELIVKWNKKVDHIGIRDYYGVVNWDWDLPGKGKGTKPLQIHESLKNFYAKNIRFYYIESLNGWVTKGLGHYIAARTLWNININPQQEIKEFYSRMFPESQKIMQPLLEQLMGYDRDIPLDKDLQVWIGSVLKAHEQVKSKDERNRIEDVVQYLYAVVLFTKRKNNNVQSYKDLYKFLQQTNDNSNYATYAIRRMLFSTFKEVMPESIITTRTSALKYKSSSKINYLEALDSVQDELQPIQWIPFDMDKNNLQFKNIKAISTRSSKKKEPISFRESHLFLINLTDKSRLGIFDGLVEYKNLKGGSVQLFSYEDDQFMNPIHQFNLVPDTINDISLKEIDPGKYWMKVVDNREGFRLTKKINMQVAIYQNKSHPLNTFYRNDFYFRVPETISQFVVRKTGSATIISPSGRVIDLQKYGKIDQLIEIENNETGYWKVENQKGSFFIEGIPPFFAREKEGLPLIKNKKCLFWFWK